MEASTSELSREIARIIACHYPASLMTLADILARADAPTVKTCIHRLPPCGITRLASIISASLSLWSYSLRIVQALCHSVEFTNALLEHNPALLDALLTKANTSQHEFDEYADLCVLLLSRPLPEAVALPQSAQPFFLRLFDRAIKTPDVETLKPIYSSLNGACRGLLNLLTPEAQHAFDKELCRILRSNSTVSSSMLILWCLGIVILAEHPHDVGRATSASSNHASPSTLLHGKTWKMASGRTLFDASNAQKTVNLTCLRVIWASKGGVGVSDSEAIEGIRIATRAMQFVDREIREGWPTSSSVAANMAPKLVNKILRTDIDTGVKLEALCFYANIVGKNNLPAEIVSQYETALLDLRKSCTDAGSLREALSFSLPIFAPQLQESSIRKLISDIIKVSLTPEGCDGLDMISALADELAAISPRCETFSHQLSRALSSNELQVDIGDLLRAKGAYQPPETSGSCNTAISAMRRAVYSTTISMLLTSALTASSTGGGLPPELTIALIRRQCELAQTTTKCSHAIANTKSTVSLLEQECTPCTGTHQAEWRDHLKSELERQNSHQQDAVIRSVALICEDLESRCANVEEPLRHEQEKVRALAAEVSQLHGQIKSLESEAVDRQLYVDGLQAELANMQTEKDDQLAELQLELALANTKADETLRTAQEDFAAKELHLRSLIDSSEEVLTTRAQEIGALNAQIKDFENKLHEERDGSEALRELHATLNTKVDAVEHELSTERQITAQRTEEIVLLKDSETSLKNSLELTKKENGYLIDQRNELQTRYDELVRSSEQALRDLETRYARDVEKARDEYVQLHTTLQDVFQEGQQTKTAYDDTRRNLQHVQAAVDSLENEVQTLTDACSEKDRELAELRSLRNRILASISVDNSLPIRSGQQPNDHGSDLKTPRQTRRRKSAMQPQHISTAQSTAGAEGITNTAMENVANASFSSSDSSTKTGPTPKRPKPRPSYKVPSMGTQNTGLGSRSGSRQLPPPKRAALGAVSPNRRHTTVGFAISEHEEYEETSGKRRGSVAFGEQESFDMDGFLTSTPFTPGNFTNGIGQEPEDTTEL